MTFADYAHPDDQGSAQPAPERVTHTSYDTEKSVLGSILLTNTALDLVINEHGLLPQHFHNRHHRNIFEAMLTLADDGHGIDPLTVSNRLNELLPDQNEFDRLRVDALAAHPPMIGNVGSYADELIRLARWRERTAAHQREAHAIATENEDAYTAARARAEQHEPVRGETLDGRALLARFDEHRQAGSDRLIGLPWRRLQDALLGGGRRGDTTLVAGHSSHGKSLVIADWCEHIADQDGHVAIYTNELNPDDYAARLLAGRTTIPFSTIMRGWFTDAQLAEYRSALVALPIKLVSVYGWPWQDIARHMRRSRWDLCCLDLFNRLPSLARTAEEDDAINGLCNAAAQADTHLIVVSQLRKGGSARAQTGEALEPSGADLRGSGMLYNSPANVVFVHRDQVQKDDTNVWERLDTGAIWADKVRNGAPGPGSAVRVQLDDQRMRFDDVEARRAREHAQIAEARRLGEAA